MKPVALALVLPLLLCGTAANALQVPRGNARDGPGGSRGRAPDAMQDRANRRWGWRFAALARRPPSGGLSVAVELRLCCLELALDHAALGSVEAVR